MMQSGARPIGVKVAKQGRDVALDSRHGKESWSMSKLPNCNLETEMQEDRLRPVSSEINLLMTEPSQTC